MRLVLLFVLLPTLLFAQTPKVSKLQRVKSTLLITVEDPFTIKTNIMSAVLHTASGRVLAESLGGLQQAGKVQLALDLAGVPNGSYELWLMFDPLGTKTTPIDVAKDLGTALSINLGTKVTVKKPVPPPKPKKVKVPAAILKKAKGHLAMPPSPPGMSR